MVARALSRPTLSDQQWLAAATLALLITGIMAVILHPIPLTHRGLAPEGGSLLAPPSDEALSASVGDPSAPPPAALEALIGNGGSGGSVLAPAPAPAPKPGVGPGVPPPPPPGDEPHGIFHILPKLPKFP
jgi:hypothetical protein